MNELALFAGAGGGILGGKLLGWTTVCAVEIEPYARAVLMARQDDGNLPAFPIWDDVRTFDGRPWRGVVDIITGGFPCQDISIAGKGAGIDGARSGLWSEMARIIREVEPRNVLVENSPMLTSRGLGRILGDLAQMGYHARWGVLGADDAGAPHERKRMWIVGLHADEVYAGRDASDTRQQNQDAPERTPAQNIQARNGWLDELGATDAAQRIHSYAGAVRILHGLADRVDRLEALGNGQVPRVAALAWLLLQPPANLGRRMKESNTMGQQRPTADSAQQKVRNPGVVL